MKIYLFNGLADNNPALGKLKEELTYKPRTYQPTKVQTNDAKWTKVNNLNNNVPFNPGNSSGSNFVGKTELTNGEIGRNMWQGKTFLGKMGDAIKANRTNTDLINYIRR